MVAVALAVAVAVAAVAAVVVVVVVVAVVVVVIVVPLVVVVVSDGCRGRFGGEVVLVVGRRHFMFTSAVSDAPGLLLPAATPVGTLCNGETSTWFYPQSQPLAGSDMLLQLQHWQRQQLQHWLQLQHWQRQLPAHHLSFLTQPLA